MVTGEKLYTVEEFIAFQQANPDTRLELIHGRIVEKVTSEEHGAIAGNIVAELRAWKRAKSISGYYSVELSVHVPTDDKNYRKPDVTFRLTDDVNVSRETALSSPPDFAVEVKSPSNGFKELRDKAAYYLENGSRLVWLVYPTKQLVEVYFEDGSLDILQVGDTLSGGDVLVGFSMPVAEVFET